MSEQLVNETLVTRRELEALPPTQPEIESDSVLRQYSSGEINASEAMKALGKIVRLTARYAKTQHDRARLFRKRAIYAESQVERMKRQRKFLHFKLEYIPLEELLKLPEGVGYVYLIQDVDVTQFYKIGITDNPYRRLTQFKIQLPFTVRVVHLIQSDKPRDLERELHRRYHAKRVNGEWFSLNTDDVLEIISMQPGTHQPAHVSL